MSFTSPLWRNQRVTLMQPLPSLSYERQLSAYSEFGSLGLATLGGALRARGLRVDAVSYPSCAAEAVQAAGRADVLVLGDFRYYTYFCNPMALLERVITALDREGFEGQILIAGRHAAAMSPRVLLPRGGHARVRVCPTMDSLARALGWPSLVESLGAGPLPAPGEAPIDLLLESGLRGSASRPTSGIAGQILIRSGCRHECTFCEKAGSIQRGFERSELPQQLRRLRDAGVGYLVVWDEVFGEPGAGYDSVLALLREAGIPFGCNTRAALVTDSFADDMARSGCRAVLMGVEVTPGEERSCQTFRVGRAKLPQRARLAFIVDCLTRRGIDPVASILVGLPDDDQSAIEARIGACVALGFKHVYARPLVPLPETTLYRQLVAGGNLEPYERWQVGAWDTFPHGYPTLCAVLDRHQICRHVIHRH